jgi:hypothetical protein
MNWASEQLKEEKLSVVMINLMHLLKLHYIEHRESGSRGSVINWPPGSGRIRNFELRIPIVLLSKI